MQTWFCMGALQGSSQDHSVYLHVLFTRACVHHWRLLFLWLRRILSSVRKGAGTTLKQGRPWQKFSRCPQSLLSLPLQVSQPPLNKALSNLAWTQRRHFWEGGQTRRLPNVHFNKNDSMIRNDPEPLLSARNRKILPLASIQDMFGLSTEITFGRS